MDGGIPYGEAVFIGLWYATILTIAIAVWIIAVQTIRMVQVLESMRQWIAHRTIANAASGADNDPTRDAGVRSGI